MKENRAGLVIGLFAALFLAGVAVAQGTGDPAVIILDVDENEQETGAPGQDVPVGPVRWGEPLQGGVEDIRGKTIEQVFTESSPLFPPLEGLPEEIWKDQTCTNCHEWTRERICEQATNYLKPEFADNLAKAHPLGGTFKANLKLWAEDGCS
ncbi:hypothetical protein FHY55_20350 [Oceanicola sp. D3]|uniref:hypothetical protein n=1 Tax=Oceanicola sp. D3 TaxID=2587163 RepID=UPI0011204FF6|nr:hypothetical protein [Oceanicola sp. D3]QDC11437.1 hypothetical protein FHY55_20350 [Oceanicola sp. D3]